MPCTNMDDWATAQLSYKLPDAKKKVFPSQKNRRRKKNVWEISPDGVLRQIQSRPTPPIVPTPSDSPSRPDKTSSPSK